MNGSQCIYLSGRTPFVGSLLFLSLKTGPRHTLSRPPACASVVTTPNDAAVYSGPVRARSAHFARRLPHCRSGGSWSPHRTLSESWGWALSRVVGGGVRAKASANERRRRSGFPISAASREYTLRRQVRFSFGQSLLAQAMPLTKKAHWFPPKLGLW